MIGLFGFNRLGDLVHAMSGDVGGSDEMNLSSIGEGDEAAGVTEL